MATAAVECKGDAVPEALISLQRPAVMTAETRAWISQRARDGKPALALASDRDALMMRVELGAESAAAAEQELADLLMDLRLLGLRPTVVTGPLL